MRMAKPARYSFTKSMHMSALPDSLRKALLVIRGVLIIFPWLLHLILADVLLSLLLPVSALSPTLAYNASSKVADSVWRAIQLIFTRVNHARIGISGSKISYGESAVVVSNHVSWTDFYLIQAVAMKAGMLGRCRWFAKQQLKWVPFLGWGLYAMGMPLVSRNWMQDHRELEHVFSRIVRNKWPIYLISFSEGTRYTSKKHAEAVSWCKVNNKAIPRHTLHPRTRGFVATIKELRRSPHVKAVYDCTIAYANASEGERGFMKAPTQWETLCIPQLSRTWNFHIHVDRHPMEELPKEDKELAAWLERAWERKGKKLEELKERWIRTGTFEQ